MPAKITDPIDFERMNMLLTKLRDPKRQEVNKEKLAKLLSAELVAKAETTGAASEAIVETLCEALQASHHSEPFDDTALAAALAGFLTIITLSTTNVDSLKMVGTAIASLLSETLKTQMMALLVHKIDPKSDPWKSME